MKYPLVTVVWDDACSRTGWQPADSVDPTPKRCSSSGYLVKRTKDAVVLMGTVTADGDACNGIVIPRTMVKVVHHEHRV